MYNTQDGSSSTASIGAPSLGIHTPPPPPAPSNLGGGGGSGSSTAGGGGSADTTGTTGTTTVPPVPGMSQQDFQNYLANDPFYQQSLAYINATGQLNTQGTALTNQGYDQQLALLQQQIGIANQKNALSVKGINEQNQYNQLGVTQDLASRQATESGDNAYYHNKVQTATDNALQAAKLDLSDYLAGAQAAMAQIGINKQQAGLQNQAFALSQQQAINAAQLAAWERDGTLFNQTHPVSTTPTNTTPTPPPLPAYTISQQSLLADPNLESLFRQANIPIPTLPTFG